MRKTAKRVWQYVLAFLLTAIYLGQKYGISLFAFPFACQKWGLVYGTLFLMIAVAATSYGQLKLYDRLQKVLHTIEWIHRIQRGECPRWYHRVFHWILNRDKRVVFTFISTQFDPFLTSLWAESTGAFKQKRLTIFLWSYVIGIIYSAVLFLVLKSLFVWAFYTIKRIFERLFL